MTDESINADNFMEIFKRALRLIEMRADAAMPLSEFTATEESFRPDWLAPGEDSDLSLKQARGSKS